MSQRAHLAWVLLLAACRLQFDERPRSDGATTDDTSMTDDASPDAKPCAPIGHDEDADSFDDACDACPQLADDQLDTDADGIGDACDPASTVQTRVLFDPFTQMTGNWIYMGGNFTVADVYRIDAAAAGAGAVMVGTPGRDTFEIIGNLVDGGPAASQISISLGAGIDHYYCELYDDGASFGLTFTHTPDEVVYNTLATTAIPGRLDSGPFRMILDHTPPTSTCVAIWDGIRYSVTAANPVGVVPTQLGFGVFQVVAEFHSFTRLTTP